MIQGSSGACELLIPSALQLSPCQSHPHPKPCLSPTHLHIAIKRQPSPTYIKGLKTLQVSLSDVFCDLNIKIKKLLSKIEERDAGKPLQRKKSKDWSESGQRVSQSTTGSNY